MLRMAKRCAVCGLASTSTLTSMARPLSSRAARSNCGAIILQGPHQPAQKSTSTGSSVRLVTESKFASVNSMGEPSNSAAPQRPQFGSSVSRADGMRLAAPQWAQATLSDGVFMGGTWGCGGGSQVSPGEPLAADRRAFNTESRRHGGTRRRAIACVRGSCCGAAASQVVRSSVVLRASVTPC